MNCSKCSTPLLPGNPVCPKCGANNDINETPIEDTESMIDLDEEEETKQVAADIAPPTLDVNSENLIQNVKDLGSGDNEATYDPSFDENSKKNHEIAEDLDGDGTPEYSSNDSVNIDIPSVTKPVDIAPMPTDGTAPSVNVSGPTLGAVGSDVKAFKIGGKTIKIKMGKKHNVPQVILIGGVIIFFIIGVMVGSTLFKQNVCIGSANKKNTNTEDVHFVADGENNVTKAGKYSFKIPKDYMYDKIESGVSVYDDKGTWRIYIKAVPGSYDNIASAKVSIEESLKTDSINIVSIKETRLNEKNHLLIECSKNLVNRLVAFVNAGNDYVFFIEIIDVDNNFNYEILNVADDLISNVEFDQKETYIENIPIYDFTDMVVSAAEANKSLNTKVIDNE